MRIIKKIDLINKIANSEEIPQTVIYKGDKYVLNNEYHDYTDARGNWLFEDIFSEKAVELLNEKITIIEELKEIEKLKFIKKEMTVEAPSNFKMADKINELIDAVNELIKEQ